MLHSSRNLHVVYICEIVCTSVDHHVSG